MGRLMPEVVVQVSLEKPILSQTVEIIDYFGLYQPFPKFDVGNLATVAPMSKNGLIELKQLKNMGL